jgi:hypothetical protein
MYHVMLNYQVAIQFLAIKCFFYVFDFDWLFVSLDLFSRLITKNVLVAVVARGACLTFRKISTCPWTCPRLTRTNRGAL